MIGSGRTAARAEPLALAIVGCGAVVESLYRRSLKRLEAQGILRVAALVDPDPARTAALGRHFKRARAFAALTQALAESSIDLTIVASPPSLHAEHVISALAAGTHVLCEKPMASRTKDAEDMVAAAQGAGRVVAVGMTRRMYPCLADAQRLLASGTLGEELRFTYREGRIYDWPVSTPAAFRRATAGGGVLTDLGSHVLDFLAALFGVPGVIAYADDGQADGVETNCRIELSFPHSAGSVQLSWNQPLQNGLHIVGSRGELVLDPGRIGALRWRQLGGPWTYQESTAGWPSGLEVAGPSGTPRTHDECIQFQVVRVLRAIVLGEPPPVTAEDALAVIRAIDACYRCATPLRLPWLTAAEQAALDARHWRRERWAAA